MVRSHDFLTALEADYVEITGETVTRPLKAALASGIVHNDRNLQKYAALGVQNSVRRAFQTGCMALQWDAVQIATEGPRALARFKSRDRVRDLLFSVGVKPASIDDDACVEHAIEVVTNQREPLRKHDLAQPFPSPAPDVETTVDVSDEPEASPSEPDALADREGLTEAEISAGALVGRVEMRVAGESRRVPRVLILHPEDPAQHVMARRDPETGELEPALRQGQMRPVVRQHDGVWRTIA